MRGIRFSVVFLSLFLLTALLGCPPRPRSNISLKELKQPSDAIFREGVAAELSGYTFEGLASYYGAEAHGGPTASGETYDMYALTCAHRTLPFGAMLRVTNLNNGVSVVVRVNDRGPFVEGRVIDLSYAAARRLKMLDEGVVPVRVRVMY